MPTATRTATRVTPLPTPSYWVVNTTADHDNGGCDPLSVGDCTLREAIRIANAGGSTKTILFDIPTSDPGFVQSQWIIQPSTLLPDLTADGVLIDGLHAPGEFPGPPPGFCVTGPTIIVDGSHAPAGAAFTIAGREQQIVGLFIRAWSADGVRVAGNGYNATVACNQILDNLGNGVLVEPGAQRNVVSGNQLSGNSGSGIHLAGADFNRVVANRIGTDVNGTAASANTGHGVHITGGAHDNEVGGEAAVDQNVVAGNLHSGVMIEGAGTDRNRLAGNLIGVVTGGTVRLGNGHHGVGLYDGAAQNRIGGSTHAPNVIGGNGWSGVAIVRSHANTVFANAIGTDLSAAIRLPNAYHGVDIVEAAESRIVSNTIAHNGAAGIRVSGAGALRNYFTTNSITGNVGKGIELLSGANASVPAPAITVTGVGSLSGTACAGCTVEIFSDPGDEGAYVHSPPYAIADAAGLWSWSGTITGANPNATATDSAGNTSEFSAAGLMFTGQISVSSEPDATRPLPVAVSLFGSAGPTQRGKRLAGASTRRDGSYEIRYGPAWVPEPDPPPDPDYAYYNLVVDDPSYEIVSATSESGGRSTPERWIQFARNRSGSGAADKFERAVLAKNDFLVRSVFAAVPQLRVEPSDKMTAPPQLMESKDFTIEGIEVTQAIQCYQDGMLPTQGCAKNNDVPLVAEKVAVVRVYVTTNDFCTVPRAEGSPRVDLHVTWPGGSYDTYAYYKAVCASGEERRKSMLGSANFFLTVPVSGTVNMWAEVNPSKNWPEPDYTNNRYPPTGSESIVFKKRKPLNVSYIMLDYKPKAAKQYTAHPGGKPNAQWVGSQAAHQLYDAIYPSPAPGYHNGGWFTYTGTDVRDLYTDKSGNAVCGVCDLLNQLTTLWNATKLSFCLKGATCTPPPDQLFGWLPANAMQGTWWGGFADAPPPVYTGKGRAAVGLDGDPTVVAHEVGHNLKRFHAPCPAAGQSGAPADIDKQWPYTNGALVQEAGLDVTAMTTVPRAHNDVMSYCAPKWISPYHWKKLFEELVPLAPGGTGGVNVGPYVLVSGLVSDQDVGRIDPLVVLDSNGDVPIPSGGAYCLEFRNASGGALARHCFDLSFKHHEFDEPLSVAPFAYAVPYPSDAAALVLVHGDVVLAQQVASTSAPEIAIVAPEGGEVWDGIQTVAWTASDADGDPLTFSVLYTHDDGASWQPLALGLMVRSYLLDTTVLPGGEDTRVRVIASDGFHSVAADSATFAVPPRAPEPRISAPAAGASFEDGQALALAGTAWDREDGSLTGAALSWWSDRDGLLGRASPALVPAFALSPGAHTITLRAVDSDGLEGSASVAISVSGQPCVGDCNLDGTVTIDELIRLVNVALGSVGPSQCEAGDRNADGKVTVDELVAAVNRALEGCA